MIAHPVCLNVMKIQRTYWGLVCRVATHTGTDTHTHTHTLTPDPRDN